MPSRFALCAVVLAIAGGGGIRADDSNDTVSVVSFLEVAPASSTTAVILLRQYRDGARKEQGNLRVEALGQIGRPGHFALIEIWKNRQAFDAHEAAPQIKQSRARLQTHQLAPRDERLLKSLYVGQLSAAGTRRVIYVLTHADSVRPASEAIPILKSLADVSRKDAGNLEFDVLQQENRANHFTIVEVWRDRQAFDRHVEAVHTKQFRADFQTITGALYDERLYEVLE